MQVLSLPVPAIPYVPRWLVCAVLGTAAFYIYSVWPYSYWKKRGIRGPPMTPLFGDMLRVVKFGGFHFMMNADIRSYGKVHGTYFLRNPVLLIADIDMIKQVCIRRSECFIDRGFVPIDLKPFDKGVIALKGQEWKRVRSILTPTFSSGKLKTMFPLIEESVSQLCAALLKEESNAIDIKAYFMNFTMDVVASSMFGLKINSQENPENEFRRHAMGMFNLNFRDWKVWAAILFPQIFKPFFKKFGITLFKKEDIQFFVNLVTDALREREVSKDAEKYRDFLASMVEAKREAENQGVKGLTEEEVMAQSLTFLLAGSETTANTMHFMAYHLAWNKSCQDRAYHEVREAKEKNGGVLTYECVQSLQYLNRCLDETLRMCPNFLMTDRLCTETTVINGFEIEKGVNVRIPIYSLAHDPDVWEDPESFNPDRFDKESDESRDQTYLIPFGVGPRNCIGMRLAQVEIRKAMAEVLLKVEFQTAPETKPFEKLEFKPAGILKTKQPIKLRVVPRLGT